MAPPKHKEVVVVGAGPAGLAAAIRAAQGGARVCVIDEAPAPGGQIYRQPPAEFRKTSEVSTSPDALRGAELLRRFRETAEAGDTAQAGKTVEFMGGTAVLGLFEDNTLALLAGERVFELRASALILATGAHERVIPFPGWTLPGVFTAGGCQIMLKAQHVLPGRRVLVAGTGPLLLVLAGQLARAGAQVAAVLEASSYATLALAPHRLWGHWGLLREGLGHLRALKRAGIPFLPRHAILEARGEGQVGEVVIGRLDRNWRPASDPAGGERTLEVDAVAVGFGFVPNTELARMAGCEHRFNAEQGGWVPVRGPGMETTVEGIYAAGDGAGVAGALVAELEGSLAGISALRQLGKLDESEAESRGLRTRLRRLARFRRALDRVSLPRPGLLSLCRPETVVCRCEEVTCQAVEAALGEGARSLDNLKRLTRAGMGFCQGRVCLPFVAALAAQATPGGEATVGWHRPRPPLRPVTISALAAEEQDGR